MDFLALILRNDPPRALRSELRGDLMGSVIKKRRKRKLKEPEDFTLITDGLEDF